MVNQDEKAFFQQKAEAVTSLRLTKRQLQRIDEAEAKLVTEERGLELRLSVYREDSATGQQCDMQHKRELDQMAAQLANKRRVIEAKRDELRARESELINTLAALDVIHESAPSQPVEPRGADKRRFFRLPLTVDVFMNTPNSFYINLTTENISQEGVFVITDEPPAAGTKVVLQIYLAEEFSLQCHGEVRWIRLAQQCKGEESPGVGVRFLGLSPLKSARLQRFIQEKNDSGDTK